MKMIGAFLCALVLATGAGFAAGSESDPLAFLVGSWHGTGGGDPGQGTGTFSFTPDLDGRILVRRAHSEYPAANGRPAVVHDDLLIVYPDRSKAVYFDNEGHAIHYRIISDAKAGSVVFLSTDGPPAPTFRLTYAKLKANEVEITFEIAPAGKSEFKTYVKGTAARQ